MPEMNVEIFSVGTWAGSAGPMKFTLDDLEDIERNFKTLKDVQDVPLKFGHNKKQPILDGQPAIGWVDKIWVQGEKLMAHFTNVPELVAKAFKKKLYKNVSIELLFSVKFEGKKYLNVLDAVALLGADRPAVGNLAELSALMSARNSLETGGSSMAFSSVVGNLNKLNEDEDMGELEDTKAKLAKAEEDLKKSQSESAEFSKKNDKLTADAEKTVTDNKVAEAKTKREEVKAVFNKAVEDKVIIPAQREAQFKLLNVEDDDAVMAIDLDTVKASLSTEAVVNFSKEDGKQEKKGDRKHKDAGTELTNRANVAMSKDKDLSFSAAFSNELTNDPELGKEYQGLTDGGA